VPLLMTLENALTRSLTHCPNTLTPKNEDHWML